MGNPVARERGLVVEEIGAELLVFDSERQVVHSLNQVAAAVWRACDGSLDVGGIAASCGLERDAVELALEELAGIELLAHPAPEGAAVSRRQVLRRAVLTGAAVGVTVPVIRSITAPTPALAASTRRAKNGRGCNSTGSCSPGSVCGAPSGGVRACYRVAGQSCYHGSSSLNTSKCCVTASCNFVGSCPAAGKCP